VVSMYDDIDNKVPYIFFRSLFKNPNGVYNSLVSTGRESTRMDFL